MKKVLTDIDGALLVQRAASATEAKTIASKPPIKPGYDATFGIYSRQDGKLGMGRN